MDKPTVIFTFDDGWLDGYVWQMWRSLPATFFLITRLYRDFFGISRSLGIPKEKLQETDPVLDKTHMDDTEVETLMERKCEIGSHGHVHARYDLLDVDEAINDLRASKKMLEGREITPYPYSFSFPGQRDGYRELVHKYFPYIRPNVGFDNPKEYPGNVWLYLWHRGHEVGTGNKTICLYCETKRLRDEKNARFITFRQACEENLISGY